MLGINHHVVGGEFRFVEVSAAGTLPANRMRVDTPNVLLVATPIFALKRVLVDDATQYEALSRVLCAGWFFVGGAMRAQYTSIAAGSSISSFTRTRKSTACCPSMTR